MMTVVRRIQDLSLFFDVRLEARVGGYTMILKTKVTTGFFERASTSWGWCMLLLYYESPAVPCNSSALRVRVISHV
jgi:hypothetical protein